MKNPNRYLRLFGFMISGDPSIRIIREQCRNPDVFTSQHGRWRFSDVELRFGDTNIILLLLS